MTRSTRWLFVVAAGAVVVYAGMWLGYRLQWSWLVSLDSAVATAMHGYGVRHAGWVRFWEIFCTVCGPAGMQVLGAAAVVFAVLRRHLQLSLFILVAIGLSGVVADMAKDLADRPRSALALAHGASTSFPSGHAVALMAGVLALRVGADLLGRKVQVAVAAVGALVTIAVGFGRVAVVAHYVSDVLAGWALGYLWFVACLVAVRPLQVQKGSGS
jgi:membrane-associated phospholipid phosphatase